MTSLSELFNKIRVAWFLNRKIKTYFMTKNNEIKLIQLNTSKYF